MPQIKDTIIVGAGPAGLVLGLLLARSGIRIRVLEQFTQATEETRAVFYNAVSQYEFKRAGIYDDIMKRALVPNSVAFRNLQGERLFSMPGAGMIALMQKDLTSIVAARLQQEKNAEILWGYRVVALGQNDQAAWVDVDSPQGNQRLEAQYIIGCDGANSIVRRELFGKEAMTGFTWDKQLVAADIRYDLASALSDTAESNVFLDANNAWIAFRPSLDDEKHWRIIYRDIDDLDGEQYVTRSQEKFKEFLIGNPSPNQYEVIRIQAYKIHQRLVDNMRQGRFILAGDAAHLCCPYGALGLNGAIADIGSLYDCLVAIHEDNANDDILDVYNDVRRDKFNTIINPQSQGTLKTIFSDPANIVPNHPMYKMSQILATNPEAAKNRPDALALRYDFTPHFGKQT